MNPDYLALTKSLYAHVENNDVDGYLTHFAVDAQYQVGNFPVLTGHDAIREIALSMINLVDSVQHESKSMWLAGDSVVICESDITYQRKDGKRIVVPAMNIIHYSGDKVVNYQAFVDPSQVLAP